MNGKDSDRIIRIGSDIYTLTEYSKPVFGEKIISYMGKRARHWDPKRSKLAAAILKGMDIIPLKPTSTVLYLGASTGTTVSYLSDICSGGKIFAVEVSFESFYKLLSLAEKRKNIIPILEDANMPERYSFFVDKPDLIYQDIAQRNQVQIFNVNAEKFPEVKRAILVIKTRSISSRLNEKDILSAALSGLKDFSVVRRYNLSPYDQANYLLYLER
ncbi:MAG: fibrillarin-like rRNA/tRNA 2'-O-methyltransferase [Candidatus Thermoplasmatota archaeon]|nr:fibrillarin-like rRNA/tRNA 2'-O-methyltransferase [Candidatus Thermoplasmatota archaeon]